KRLQQHEIPVATLIVDALAIVASKDIQRAQQWSQIFGVALPQPKVTAIDVAGLGNDDPWRANLGDQLGVGAEARAIARVAAARQFDPPMAFGIFGDWGSGKSFFMRLIHDHIDQLSDGEAPEADSGAFHQHIVQIRFNAWHYVETNLWASL